ncbi:MAG: von Willebrand factor, type [Acidobacteriales bacterium]|nr:von Willebrand factor, type [Terriglobales bacterium]
MRLLAISLILLSNFSLVQTQPAAPPQPKQENKLPPRQEKPSDDQTPQFKVDVKLVNVFATVTDPNGAPIVDLKKEDFALSEDGVAQKIAVFEQQSEVPLSIVLALDASGSIRKDLKLELDSARKFVSSTLRPSDGLALFQFSETVKELVHFTSDFQRIARGIKAVQVGSATALYDAIYLGGEALADRRGRKVMVIITDGGDTMSRTTYGEAVRAAQQAEAIVYSIIIVPIAASAGRNTGGEHALIQLSKDTGGKHYYADTPQTLDAAFQQISRELRTQYLLGYYPSQRLADSDFRKIDISITRAGANLPAVTKQDGDSGDPAPTPYKVRHRRGYYTSKLN